MTPSLDRAVEAARESYSADRISIGEILDKIAGRRFADRIIAGILQTGLPHISPGVDREALRGLAEKWRVTSSGLSLDDPRAYSHSVALDGCADDLITLIDAKQE